MQNQAQTTADQKSAQHVVALLSEQRELYLQLSRLADQQRGMITGNEPERLLTILAERQRLIDRLTVTGRELKPYQANWRQLRDTLPGDQAKRIDALVAEVNSLLSAILKKDEADTALLSARKSEAGRALGTLHVGKRAGAAYAASGSTGSGMDWASA